ncbi:MAG: hypothetical protein JJU08_02595 [Rhodobacteraceae bacterium]|nr:hypothetical protein [Paracoccaceae bacterium]
MIVMILGSGPGVVVCRDWSRGAVDRIVAINNAWQVRPDWDYLVHPEDFPNDRHPPDTGADRQIITATEYVPANNDYGGIIYAGATMAFSAGYWALAALRPTVLAYLGCDMVYDHKTTHFYGTGTADPLRPDPTLQDLGAKSARLELLAARQGCAVVNLSDCASRLVFARCDIADIHKQKPRALNPASMERALGAEQALGAICPSGRYWQGPALDATALAGVDQLWRDAHAAACAGSRAA